MASTVFEVDLGHMADTAQRLLTSGEYASMDELVQDAIQALDRETAAFEAWQHSPAFDEMLRQKVQEALDDPRPPIPIDEAFAELDRRIAARRGRKVHDEAA